MNLYRVEVVNDSVQSPALAVGSQTRTYYVLARSTEQAMLLGRSRTQYCNRIRLVELLAEAGQVIAPSPANLDYICTELQ